MPRKKKVSKSSSVTPTDAPVSAVTEPDTGDDQLSDLPQTRPRSATHPIHQNPKPKKRPSLVNTSRTQNTVPNAGPKSVGPSNKSNQQQRQHYYIMQQHMSQALNFPHQNRNTRQGMPQYFPIPYNQQAFGQQPYPYNMSYQTLYYPPISGTIRGNKKVDESLQKKELPKREKHIAIITDPNTGENLNLEELAPKVVSKNQNIITATNDSNSEAINSESSSKSNELVANSDATLFENNSLIRADLNSRLEIQQQYDSTDSSNQLISENNELGPLMKNLSIKTKSELNYKKNQWSPENPDGKRQYDRKFLLAVRERVGDTLEIPERLVQIAPDIIKRPFSADPFLSNYLLNEGELRRRSMPANISFNRRQSKPRLEKPRKSSVTFSQEVQQNATENTSNPSKQESTKKKKRRRTQSMIS